MSVGFGFSVGDFIAALQLVSTIINALRDSSESSTEYIALLSQLLTLETALLRVKRLEADDEQRAEVIALRQAACQCQRTIDVFLEKITKYQPSLRTGGSGSGVRNGWRKIQWALCKKEDLLRFKADLVGHTESIELLLTTLHIRSTALGQTTATETTGAETLVQRPARYESPQTSHSDNDGPAHTIPSLGQPLLPVLHCKMCTILFYLWIFLATTSLAVGLWRSLATSDEGKGFTDAAYVIAVGGLVIYPIQNRHALRCRLNKQ